MSLNCIVENSIHCEHIYFISENVMWVEYKTITWTMRAQHNETMWKMVCELPINSIYVFFSFSLIEDAEVIRHNAVLYLFFYIIRLSIGNFIVVTFLIRHHWGQHKYLIVSLHQITCSSFTKQTDNLQLKSSPSSQIK